MYKNVLQSIQGIEVYPLISLVIFALFFIGLIIWLFKIDKSYIKEMEILPLDLDEKAEAKNEI
jgi:cytochrome c oxidase cbb3-type subunit IV